MKTVLRGYFQHFSAWSCILCALMLFSMTLRAQTQLLSAEQAFPVAVESVSEKEAQLRWSIPENYYLYQHKFEVRQGQQSVALKLPAAVELHDDNYGQTQVYFDRVQFSIPVQPSATYQVSWQGCAKDRICYPPQTIEFQTDADGLVLLQNQAKSAKRLLDMQTPAEPAQAANNQNTVQTEASSNSAGEQDRAAQDQFWSQQLMKSSPFYGVLLFLGLGFLLAFTPCSLPMLPILTSLIIRNNKGLKAWMIALVFVCSMAVVYALLGLVASSAGLNFQRWLQQPSTLILFSLLFVVFALNLFGLFEIRLPQALMNKLDQAQSMQKGGSLAGAAVMGMISALLVGPCMTAPLAGALLFISQTQSQWQGALLLFCLGFGMGIPMLLVSVLGARVLPKAGTWMNQIKVLFAFIMLGLALYFVRPLLSESWMQWLSLILGLIFIVFLLHGLFTRRAQLKWLYLLVLAVLIPYMGYTQYQFSQRFMGSESTVNIEWHHAQTAGQFQQLLAQAPADQPVVIDVYADWCVACQPIEHKILKSAAVKHALSPFYLIKLDLSHYDTSHQTLLNQWEILGPPTYLFLTGSGQEIRNLRLTGTFTEQQLLEQLQKAQSPTEH